MIPDSRHPSCPRDITIDTAGVRLNGELTFTDGHRGLVIFAHGSGSSRHSPRNRAVAETLNDAGLATLLFDLLTDREEPWDQYSRSLRFNIPLLGERLTGTVDWALDQSALAALPIGIFGASTGAAAAIIAATARPRAIQAVVSRGGRVDLAAHALPRLRAATLLIVGGHDETVLSLNEAAAARMACTHRIEIVHGATHLFEETGALERVAALAARWFGEHLAHSPSDATTSP